MWTTPFKLLDSVLDRVLAVVGGLLLAQVPAFLDAYMQRLDGHLGEAQRNIASWQEIADRVHLGDLHALAESYQAAQQPEVVEAGRKLAEDMVRLDELRAARKAIAEAPVWQRAAVFLWNMDSDIVRATAKEYVPNLPLDAESLIYGFLGLVLMLALYQGSKAGVKGVGRKILRPAQKQMPPRRRQAPQR